MCRRTHGEWEAWITFFLDGVVDVARSATATTQRIATLVEADRQRLFILGRAAGSAGQLHYVATRDIVFTIPQAAQKLGFGEVTIAKAAAHLERLGIVREVTGKSRNKIYSYTEYLSLVSEGTNPSPPN